MAFATSNGIKLYFEETGSGAPIVFVHEFAGDYRAWEPQVRFFSRRYRCITFNARGYPPSEVPASVDDYSQRHAVEDIANVMRHIGLGNAHIVGLSQGGYATLHFGLDHPDLARSLVVAGAGHGSDPHMREQFLKGCNELVERLEKFGMAEGIKDYALAPTRLAFKEKDPRGFAEFTARFGEHSAQGSALNMRGYQMRRPTIYDLEARLKTLNVPTLIVTGDDDTPCLEPGLFMKRTIPGAMLWVAPRTGHCINLEEIDDFNRTLLNFFTLVDGRADR
jgi:pimeloyl-ACP methyl ester carboxylesterase